MTDSVRKALRTSDVSSETSVSPHAARTRWLSSTRMTTSPSRFRPLSVLLAIGIAVTVLILAAPTAIAAGKPTRSYPTNSGHVRIFQAPQTHARTVRVLTPRRTKVTLGCYTQAQAVHGDRIWYRVTAPTAGYISGAYLATGHDPVGGLPHCPR